MRVTAITHRKNAIVASYLSQVTPSESSAIKRVSYEPMFLAHLRNALGVRGVKRRLDLSDRGVGREDRHAAPEFRGSGRRLRRSRVRRWAD